MIRKMEKLSCTVSKMQEAFQWVQTQVTGKWAISLIHSMLERMVVVIAAEGGHTRQ